MSGSLHDVKNDVWMRAVIVSVILLFVGAAAYGAFAVGVGTVKKNEWDAAYDDYNDAKAELVIVQETEYDDPDASFAENAAAEKAVEEAEEAKIDAHLSYLTWVTAGKTILLMMIIYSAFYGISGFYNSIHPKKSMMITTMVMITKSTTGLLHPS